MTDKPLEANSLDNGKIGSKSSATGEIITMVLAEHSSELLFQIRGGDLNYNLDSVKTLGDAKE